LDSLSLPPPIFVFTTPKYGLFRYIPQVFVAQLSHPLYWMVSDGSLRSHVPSPLQSPNFVNPLFFFCEGSPHQFLPASGVLPQTCFFFPKPSLDPKAGGSFPDVLELLTCAGVFLLKFSFPCFLSTPFLSFSVDIVAHPVTTFFFFAFSGWEAT